MDKFERGHRLDVSVYYDWCGITREEIDKIIGKFNSVDECFPIESLLFYYAHTERTNEIDRRDLENSFKYIGFDGEEIK